MPDSNLSSEVKQNMEVWVVSALPQLGEQIPKLILEGSGWVPSDLEGLKLDCTAYAACGMEVAAPSIFAKGPADARQVGNEASQILDRELRNIGNAWQDADVDEVAGKRFNSTEDSIFDEFIGDERYEEWKEMYETMHSPPVDRPVMKGTTEQYMRGKWLDYKEYLNAHVGRKSDIDEVNDMMDNYFVKDISGDLANLTREATKAPESAFDLEIFNFIIRFGNHVYEDV